MDIERLEADRIDAVVQLSLRAWAPVFESIETVLHPKLYRQSYPDGWEATQGQAVHDVCASSDFEVFTTNEGKETLGFVAIRLDEKTKMGEIYMIAVDPDHQGRGIASSLTEFAVTRMKEAGMEVALVETGADPGQNRLGELTQRQAFIRGPR